MNFKTTGNNLYSSGLKERAVDAYTKGIELIEDRGDEASAEDKKCLPVLYCNRSKAHLDLCLVDEAHLDAELAIEANPEHAKAYLRRAEVLLNQFKNKEALSDLDKAEDLEPGLAPRGCEMRLRATGEKWVPNCYLQRQVELRKKHNCDYVVLLTLDGEDIVESIAINDGNPLRTTLVRTLTRTLQGDEVTLRRVPESIAGYVSTATASKIEKAALEGLVADQLAKELGAETPLLEYRTSPIREEHPYFLLSIHPRCKNPSDPDPVLFPGAPRWVYDRKILAAMIDVKVFEEGLDTEQRATLEREYEGIRQVHLSQRNSRMAAEGDSRSIVCHGCGKTITDPDPQECICRRQFCHLNCSVIVHWNEDKEMCLNDVQSQCDKGRLTLDFWALAMKGYFPLKEGDPPDLVSLWKERGFECENQHDALVAELKFYKEHEIARFVDELNHTPVEEFHRLDLFLRWTQRMSSPLHTDSCVRKFYMCAQIRMVGLDRGVAHKPDCIPQPARERAEMFHAAVLKRGFAVEEEFGYRYLEAVLDRARARETELTQKDLDEFDFSPHCTCGEPNCPRRMK